MNNGDRRFHKSRNAHPRYALATHTLRTRYAHATHSLRTRYALATHMLRTRYALAVDFNKNLMFSRGFPCK